MGLVEDIIQGEALFARRFANVEERQYGLLYHLAEIPDSHDGNRAIILRPNNAAATIADIRSFYRGKGLVPRVLAYPVPQEAGWDEIRVELLAAGFHFVVSGSQCYVHRRPSRINPVRELTIQRVQSPSPELLTMIEQSDSTWGMNVVRRSLAWPDYHLLVGFLDGRPVTMAAVERTGPVSAVDDVVTHTPFRGRGYARAMMHELVRYHSNVLGGTLYLRTDNPTAARIYEEAGFAQLDVAPQRWRAWQD